MTKRYQVKEVFYSLQGEGVRAGEPSLFVRFAGCNLACSAEREGFDCDTDFVGGTAYTADELELLARRTADPECDWVVFTGGEPALQLDRPLAQLFRAHGWFLAVETNGTRPLPMGLDWVCCSPKPGAPVVLTEVDEVKVVLAAGQPLPGDGLRPLAKHYLVSPAFEGDKLPPENLQWAIRLCLENPPWRLSVQQHKAWGVR